MDDQKEKRRNEAVEAGMDTFIISQALAGTTLRVTGVNFFNEEGKPGSTGEPLEQFLNLFNRTIYPPREIHLDKVTTIPACKSGLMSVYNTEIAQCYPGENKKGPGDRRPKKAEVLACKEKGFLEEELALLKPRLVLLMGKVARDSFFRFYLDEGHPPTLKEHIEEVKSAETLPEKTLRGQRFYVCPIQHASGANPGFKLMLKDKVLIKTISEALTGIPSH
jgi:hypothetical protein